ncbi:type VII secretion integral membrane protein EccD [Nocardiopsis sp. NPDC006938]|uniref:type VII secretion integral membrane protein EccD n=1 Tax=Nocardiopsis sp. NPDC006938 TaxID=3364337 RepID=UPI0036889539
MSGYCRVTVTGPDRWADLVLPGGVSVAALMPQVVRVCSPADDGLRSARWNLVAVDGTPIPSEGSLVEAGVRDGDVLLLDRVTAPDRPSFVDDVRGTVEDRVDERAWLWKPTTTLGFGLSLAALGPLLVMVALVLVRSSPLDLAVSVLGLLTALGAVWLAGSRDLPGVAHAAQSAACGWGALTTVLAVLGVGATAPTPIVTVLFACFGALAASVGGWALAHRLLPYLAGLSVVTASLVLLVGLGLFTDGPMAVRLLAVLLALGIGALPRMALALGGLSGLDYEVRQVGQTDNQRFEESLANSDRMLTGTILGVSVAATLSVGLLALTGDGRRDLVLAALVSLALLMRSRLFDRVSHVLPVRLTGVLGLAVTGVAATTAHPALAGALPAVVLVACVAVAALSAIRLTDVPRASLRRLLNGVEIAVVAGMCVAAVWSLGVYEAVSTVRIGG